MFLNAINNQSTDFALFAFEGNPKSTEPADDWVEMKFHIKMDDYEYHVTDACLTALEIFRLAKWMRDIATKVPVEKKISFMEPNLSFKLDYDYGKTKIIKITYAAELRPYWFKEDKPYCQLFHCGNRELIKISATLMAELNDLYSKIGGKMEDGSGKMGDGSRKMEDGSGKMEDGRGKNKKELSPDVSPLLGWRFQQRSSK